jgi:hypothetical protein
MFEIEVECGECGELLTITASKINNGGLRLLCYAKKHTCFGGDQEQGNVPNFSNITNNEEERGVK